MEAVQDMVREQERNLMDARASDEVLSCRAFTGPDSDYLGELKSAVLGLTLTLRIRITVRLFGDEVRSVTYCQQRSVAAL